MLIRIDLTEEEIGALERIIVAEDAGTRISDDDNTLRRAVIERILMESGDFLVEHYAEED